MKLKKINKVQSHTNIRKMQIFHAAALEKLAIWSLKMPVLHAFRNNFREYIHKILKRQLRVEKKN